MLRKIAWRGAGREDRTIDLNPAGTTILRAPSGWGKSTAMHAAIMALCGDGSPVIRCYPAEITATTAKGTVVRWDIRGPGAQNRTRHAILGGEDSTPSISEWRRLAGLAADAVRAPLVMEPERWLRSPSDLRDALIIDRSFVLTSWRELGRAVDAAVELVTMTSSHWREGDPLTRQAIGEAAMKARKALATAQGAVAAQGRTVAGLAAPPAEVASDDPQATLDAAGAWSTYDQQLRAHRARAGWEKWHEQHPRPARPTEGRMEECREVLGVARWRAEDMAAKLVGAEALVRDAGRAVQTAGQAVRASIGRMKTMEMPKCPTCGAEPPGPDMAARLAEEQGRCAALQDALTSAEAQEAEVKEALDAATLTADSSKDARDRAQADVDRIAEAVQDHSSWQDARAGLGPEPPATAAPVAPECVRPSQAEVDAAMIAARRATSGEGAREERLRLLGLAQAEEKRLQEVAEERRLTVQRIEALERDAKAAPQALIDQAVALLVNMRHGGIEVVPRITEDGVEIDVVVGPPGTPAVPYHACSTGERILADALLRAGLRRAWGMERVQIWIDCAQSWSGRDWPDLSPCVMLVTEGGDRE